MNDQAAADKTIETKGTNPPANSPEIREYRDWLVQADHKSLEAYDKAVMTLSGGALAISLTFINDILASPIAGTLYLLIFAWVFLALSITAILVSMLGSHWALRKAIGQVDRGEILRVEVGGWFTRLTNVLNVVAGAAFVLGVALLAWFAIANMTPL